MIRPPGIRGSADIDIIGGNPLFRKYIFPQDIRLPVKKSGGYISCKPLKIKQRMRA